MTKTILALLATLLGLVACSTHDQPGDGASSGGGGGPGDPGAPGASGDHPGGSSGADAGPRPHDIGTGPKFQTKSAEQLKNAVEVCVGKGATLITDEMISGEPPVVGVPDRYQGFLTRDFADYSRYPVATDGNRILDIIDGQLRAFDGDPGLLRSGTRPDQLTLGYLTALRNMANVVGVRCARGLVANPALCKCDTTGDAAAIIARCLPYVTPTDPAVAAAAGAMAEKCQADPARGIASMLSSTAFAKFR
jgi:hypothetical protein